MFCATRLHPIEGSGDFAGPMNMRAEPLAKARPQRGDVGVNVELHGSIRSSKALVTHTRTRRCTMLSVVVIVLAVVAGLAFASVVGMLIDD